MCFNCGTQKDSDWWAQQCSRYVKLLDIWASDFVPRPRSLSGLGGAEAEVEQEPKACKFRKNIFPKSIKIRPLEINIWFYIIRLAGVYKKISNKYEKTIYILINFWDDGLLWWVWDTLDTRADSAVESKRLYIPAIVNLRRFSENTCNSLRNSSCIKHLRWLPDSCSFLRSLWWSCRHAIYFAYLCLANLQLRPIIGF